jgi:hypothetical protein
LILASRLRPWKLIKPLAYPSCTLHCMYQFKKTKLMNYFIDSLINFCNRVPSFLKNSKNHDWKPQNQVENTKLETPRNRVCSKINWVTQFLQKNQRTHNFKTQNQFKNTKIEKPRFVFFLNQTNHSYISWKSSNSNYSTK